jgi:dTDP-4-amino-4,6-dideoxygalactose transaminase
MHYFVYLSLTCHSGSSPVAEAAARQLLSLPLYPELTLEQQDVVIAAVRTALA